MRTAMKDNKSMDFALEEAMKERGIVSEVVGAPVVYYNGHHYTLDHDTKTGLFSVLHTTGRDRGYRVLGEAGKTRDPKSALDMAEAHSKTMKEAENNPLIAALTERMKSDKEKESIPGGAETAPYMIGWYSVWAVTTMSMLVWGGISRAA